MHKRKEWIGMVLAALSAFSVYTCMYAFRKPFTAANYSDLEFLKIDYKIWLVICQTIGYTLSKFYGIRFIAELKPAGRAAMILFLIGVGWLSLLLFAVTPPPYNMVFLLLNGFPLGMIYGLVFSYLEGRRSTEFLGAVLAASFIFASGFTQSVGKHILVSWNVDHWWMPFVTGSVFIIPVFLFTILLSRTPAPSSADIGQRTLRKPMNKEERRKLIDNFFPGLVVLIIAYVMLTVIRDYRSNFASNIWTELGITDASLFTKTEIPASLVTLGLMSALVLIRKNIRALMMNHVIIAAGFLISIISTLLYMNHWLDPFWWMTLVGVGLYMGYVPFNCMLFDRLISTFKYAGNAGFLIYLADSFGYLGSDVVLIAKNFLDVQISWTDFFIKMVIIFSGVGILLISFSAFYFRNKYLYKDLTKTDYQYA